MHNWSPSSCAVSTRSVLESRFCGSSPDPASTPADTRADTPTANETRTRRRMSSGRKATGGRTPNMAEMTPEQKARYDYWLNAFQSAFRKHNVTLTEVSLTDLIPDHLKNKGEEE